MRALRSVAAACGDQGHPPEQHNRACDWSVWNVVCLVPGGVNGTHIDHRFSGLKAKEAPYHHDQTQHDENSPNSLFHLKISVEGPILCSTLGAGEGSGAHISRLAPSHSSRDVRDQRNNEQHQENEKQNLRDAGREQ